MDNDFNLWAYPKTRIESAERIEESTMPSYAQTLTESDLDDLVAYMFSLRKEI
jgi:mono/diheme cytochrome c family protein